MARIMVLVYERFSPPCYGHKLCHAPLFARLLCHTLEKRRVGTKRFLVIKFCIGFDIEGTCFTVHQYFCYGYTCGIRVNKVECDEMRIVFMGTPGFAVLPLEQLVLNGYQVAAVYTQPDKPTGRGRTLAAPPVRDMALSLKLPVEQPASLKDEEAVERLAEYHPDVIVVAAFGQILPQRVLDIPRYGCLNVHPSLLPRFRGSSPVAGAILAGDEYIGVTIMLLDRGMDTGPILTRAQVPVLLQDTTGSLTERLSFIGARLLIDALLRWTRGEITPRPQSEVGVTYSKPVSKEDGRIDWKLPSVEIGRRVRAFNPWPGCYTRWQGKQLKIVVATPSVGAGTPGQVVTLGKDGVRVGVCTGEGILELLEVQLEGKRAMSAAEFLRGQREFIGIVLS